jgi:hypothetical protein
MIVSTENNIYYPMNHEKLESQEKSHDNDEDYDSEKWKKQGSKDKGRQLVLCSQIVHNTVGRQIWGDKGRQVVCYQIVHSTVGRQI